MFKCIFARKKYYKFDANFHKVLPLSLSSIIIIVVVVIIIISITICIIIIIIIIIITIIVIFIIIIIIIMYSLAANGNLTNRKLYKNPYIFWHNSCSLSNSCASALSGFVDIKGGNTRPSLSLHNMQNCLTQRHAHKYLLVRTRRYTVYLTVGMTDLHLN